MPSVLVEEPIRMENIDALADAQAEDPDPAGDRRVPVHQVRFPPDAAKQAADIIQPDICLAGGMLELKKIAAMAEAHYVRGGAAQSAWVRWPRW